MSSTCNEELFQRLCGMPVVRDGKCEEHKVERRKQHLYGDRRRFRSSDAPTSCGNGACRSEFDSEGKVVTIHHKWCDDHGPGWA